MNIQDPDTLTEAAFNGDLETVRSLVEAGADINVIGKVWNPLHAAIENQKTTVVQYLLQSGADPNFAINGFSPLLHAIDIEIDAAQQCNQPELASAIIVEILVAEGADFNSRVGGETALRMAIDRGHERAAEYLRSQGAV